MRVIYECGVCRTQFNLKENCISCEKKHKQEVIFKRIELVAIEKNYGFRELNLRVGKDFSPDTDVKCHGLYDEYPNFSTECLDTPQEVLDAKGRLIQAALDWIRDYKDTIQMMLDELKKEQGK